MILPPPKILVSTLPGVESVQYKVNLEILGKNVFKNFLPIKPVKISQKHFFQKFPRISSIGHFQPQVLSETELWVDVIDLALNRKVSGVVTD